MARKGLRKLIDIHAPAGRLQSALENFLTRHSISFEKHYHAGDDFYRYLVNSRDLCCAQAVIPALQQMAEGGSHVS